MKLSEVKVELVQTRRLLANEEELLNKVLSDVASAMGDINSRLGTGESAVTCKIGKTGIEFTDKRTAYKWKTDRGAKCLLFASEVDTQATEKVLGITLEWKEFPWTVATWIDFERKKLKDKAEAEAKKRAEAEEKARLEAEKANQAKQNQE